jgi:iron complex outermembrane recepter protein
MRKMFLVGVAAAALFAPSAAFAQSTGTIDFNSDEGDVVVEGRRERDVGGVEVPDQPKTRTVLNSEIIQRQRPGQAINEIINLVPGVSFQSNDPFGASGGSFTVRGFNSDRVTQTVDGVPLNDTGNYAIYANQQQDPETVETVNVALGTTDVDTPTASAVGGTIDIRTIVPQDTLGGIGSFTYGSVLAPPEGNDIDYTRAFALIHTGDLTGHGTKAWFSASTARYRSPFNNYSRLRRDQWNGKIYQEIGSNGDFVSVAGNYNQNRNNFFASVPLRTDLTASPFVTTPRVVGTGSGNRFPTSRDERFYNINYPCNIDTPQAGVSDTLAPAPASPTAGASCGTEYDRRYNPSNTGNIRGNSRFTLADGLVLTVDPSFQYVKANGGGTVTLNEAAGTLSGNRAPGVPFTGVLNLGPGTGGFGYYVGRDVNGDGDVRDQVVAIAPSQTQTRRFAVISSLAYDLNETNRIRVTYTFDRGRHRQTGEAGLLQINGEPFDVFPVNDPVTDVNGNVIQKRNRKSIALLNQISGEYRGEFLDGNLVANLGVRYPMFKRDLDQRCFTVAANGNVSCVPDSLVAAYAAANPYVYNATTGVATGFAPPGERTYKYDKLLPNVGATFHFTPTMSVYGQFSQNVSVPGTDTLYNVFLFPEDADGGSPVYEKSDSFDLGLRYTSGSVQASIAGWWVHYNNRLASAYDPVTDTVITRNLGTVDNYGVDANLSFRPVRQILAYVWGNYLWSKIDEDVQSGATSFYQTAGNRVSGAPEYTIGARLQGELGPLTLGVQYKRTGRRWLNDENAPVTQTFTTGSGATAQTQTIAVYGATAPAYDIVDLDARFSLADYGLARTFIQVNVTNLFDELYVAGVGGNLSRTSVPFAQIGSPRAATASLVVQF